MKIDGHSPSSNIEQVTTNATDAVRTRSGSPADKAGKAGHTDTVELSAEAQFVGRSIQAASSGPVIRQDKVEQAKQKLSLGEIGADAYRLADKLIDHMIEE
jgi:flagellar biosynthesis anti-sigma factor FlgM